MFGGGRKDLKNNLLPLDLQYLFQNEYLDCMKILIVLYQLRRRRKGVNIEELNYYYTMIDLLEGAQECEPNQEYYQDNYLINEEKMRGYGILIKNQDFIEINVENTTKKTTLYYKLTQAGMQLVEGLEDEYFDKIRKRVEFVNSTMKYSVSNQRKVMSRNEK